MRRAVALSALCLLMSAVPPARSAPPAPLTVTLPDGGTYSLWVQAKSGAVSVLPSTVAHKKAVPLPGARAGDTLYVLDAHTGNVAARPLTPSGPVTLAVSDFRPVSAPAPPTAPVAPPAPIAPSPTRTPASGAGAFVSWLLGLALAAGVVWFLIRLVQTRGEPLVALARRVGIDVPDPKALDANAGAMPVYQPPKPRTVEAIPDDAGVPVVNSRLVSAPAGPEPDSPQLVGTQGLAAGSTFGLTDDDVSVGRDGGNGIVLAEDSVSRRHARLTRDAQGAVHLADTGSANGVFVNGQRVQDVVLAHGDEIQIGDNSFRFETPAA